MCTLVVCATPLSLLFISIFFSPHSFLSLLSISFAHSSSVSFLFFSFAHSSSLSFLAHSSSFLFTSLISLFTFYFFSTFFFFFFFSYIYIYMSTTATFIFTDPTTTTTHTTRINHKPFLQNILQPALPGNWVLTSVAIGAGTTEIQEGLFQNITSLKTVAFEPGSALSEIPKQLFKGCTGLIGVTIPPSVISMGDGAFGECTSLVHVSGMEGLTSIGEYAFYKCPKLDGVTIPTSVTSIKKKAFEECWSLKSMTFPKSLTSIGTDAFLGSGLTKVTLYYGNIFHQSPAKNVMFRGAIVEIIIIGAPRPQVLPMIFSLENGPPLGAYHRPNTSPCANGGAACARAVQRRT